MRLGLMYSPELTQYDFGPGHPYRGDRFLRFMRYFQQLRHKLPPIDIIQPNYATDSQLQLVHSPEYIKYVSQARSQDVFTDTPLNPQVVKAARLIAGAGIQAGELVWSSKYTRICCLGGGMHHASFEREAGFCIFNDVALCTKNLIENHGLDRILILDTDAHAGDGTQEIFYEDPRVLVISIHQDPSTLYPGRGFIHELGSGDGEGYTISIPLPPLAGAQSYRYALDEILMPVASQFKPQLVLRNGGSDPHHLDQLTRLGLDLKGLRMLGEYAAKLANLHCSGKLVDFIGSGYNPRILAQAWMAILCGSFELELEIQDEFPAPPEPPGVFQATRSMVAELKSLLRNYWEL